jgi:hypothetical protein
LFTVFDCCTFPTGINLTRPDNHFKFFVLLTMKFCLPAGHSEAFSMCPSHGPTVSLNYRNGNLGCRGLTSIVPFFFFASPQQADIHVIPYTFTWSCYSIPLNKYSPILTRMAPYPFLYLLVEVSSSVIPTTSQRPSPLPDANLLRNSHPKTKPRLIISLTRMTMIQNRVRM